MALTAKPLEEVRASVPVHLVTRDEMVQVNITVPASVRRAWKQAAVKADKTVLALVTEAMDAYLEAPQ